MSAQSVVAIARRWDSLAIEQLRAEVVRLSQENDELRDQLYWAEQAADSWRHDATEQHLQLCEALGGSPGITMDGRLVVVTGGSA